MAPFSSLLFLDFIPFPPHFLQSEKLHHHRCFFRVFCLFLLFVPFLCISLLTHAKDFLHVLIHHIGDADSRNDFEEVRGDATIKARYTFMGYNVFELAHH